VLSVAPRAHICDLHIICQFVKLCKLNRFKNPLSGYACIGKVVEQIKGELFDLN
jgi:hypothetical protein